MPGPRDPLFLAGAQLEANRFRAATDSPFQEPLAMLLRRSVGVEAELRTALDRPDVVAAVIHGSWAAESRRPGSDIDVLAVGEADLRELRRQLRPVGAAAGRTIDLTVMRPDEFRSLAADLSSFARRLLEGPTTPLVGDLGTLAPS